MNPNVTHPKHYNQGKIEVIEFIEDKDMNYSRGNAIKYIVRAGRKMPQAISDIPLAERFRLRLTTEIDDLEKAVWYIQREIELVKAMLERRDPARPNDMNPRKDPSGELIEQCPPPPISNDQTLRESPPIHKRQKRMIDRFGEGHEVLTDCMPDSGA